MTDIRALQVWNKAQALSLTLHHRLDARTCAKYAPGLRAQLLRAAASVPASLLEGGGRGADLVPARHLAAAIASAGELENHLLLAAHLGAVRGDPDDLFLEVADIRAMLYALRRALEHRPRGGAGEGDRRGPPQMGEGA
ncbi:MAG: four helix bundle protein [Gemmatimonadetes bacterium]|nr:four helix bundle protein [Gemmatimonadota bacterium]